MEKEYVLQIVLLGEKNEFVTFLCANSGYTRVLNDAQRFTAESADRLVALKATHPVSGMFVKRDLATLEKLTVQVVKW